MNNHSGQNLMYASLPNIIIGFHGCDYSTYKDVLYNHNILKPSTNSYDWLGNGMYFWEQNLERAWEWANNNKSISQPAVIGAVIDLGYCLNLLDSKYTLMLKDEYDMFEIESLIFDKAMPINKNVKGNTDLLLRHLDCAVIEHLHKSREQSNETPFDSVRGVFFEGDPIYETSGFREQSHIQICVRNPNCIKGFFAPMEIDDKWRMP